MAIVENTSWNKAVSSLTVICITMAQNSHLYLDNPIALKIQQSTTMKILHKQFPPHLVIRHFQPKNETISKDQKKELERQVSVEVQKSCRTAYLFLDTVTTEKKKGNSLIRKQSSQIILHILLENIQKNAQIFVTLVDSSGDHMWF